MDLSKKRNYKVTFHFVNCKTHNAIFETKKEAEMFIGVVEDVLESTMTALRYRDSSGLDSVIKLNSIVYVDMTEIK